MPQYAVISTHLHSHCPGANGAARQVFEKVEAQVPATGQKHGVRPVVGPLHLDPTHSILVIVEAASADAVYDFLMDSRLAEVQDTQVYRTALLAALLENAPDPLY